MCLFPWRLQLEIKERIKRYALRGNRKTNIRVPGICSRRFIKLSGSPPSLDCPVPPAPCFYPFVSETDESEKCELLDFRTATKALIHRAEKETIARARGKFDTGQQVTLRFPLVEEKVRGRSIQGYAYRRRVSSEMGGEWKQDMKEREMTDKNVGRGTRGSGRTPVTRENPVDGRNLGTLGNQSPLMKIPCSKRTVF